MHLRVKKYSLAFPLRTPRFFIGDPWEPLGTLLRTVIVNENHSFGTSDGDHLSALIKSGIFTNYDSYFQNM